MRGALVVGIPRQQEELYKEECYWMHQKETKCVNWLFRQEVESEYKLEGIIIW